MSPSSLVTQEHAGNRSCQLSIAAMAAQVIESRNHSLVKLKRSLRSTKRPLLRSVCLWVLEVRTPPLPVLAQLPTYLTTHRSALCQLESISSGIKIRCQVHPIPIFLFTRITAAITRPSIRSAVGLPP